MNNLTFHNFTRFVSKYALAINYVCRFFEKKANISTTNKICNIQGILKKKLTHAEYAFQFD